MGESATATAGVIDNVMSNSTDFLTLVSNIGNTCANNEICVAFLTFTFIGLGVRLLRKVIGAFGRGR